MDSLKDVGMMTNDQIHAPVNAFSAKYLLVILRISIFLNPPVTACQDHVLYFSVTSADSVKSLIKSSLISCTTSQSAIKQPFSK